LSGAGITLQEDSKDSLIWTGGDASGRMTVKNFYNAISNNSRVTELERLEGQSLEMEITIKNHSILLAGIRKQDLIMGRLAEKRLDGTGHMHFMQRIRGRY
jgi:hypothetical protein